MEPPKPYDLLVILAGDKPRRHPAAVELMQRGWARYVTVTGEHERIEHADGLDGRVISASPSSSTYEDALSIRGVVQNHQFLSVLVVTSASQCDRARLALRRAFCGTAVTVDVLSWEPATPGDYTAEAAISTVLRRHFSELCKLAYYRVLRRL